MTAKFALADTIDNRETRRHDTVKKNASIEMTETLGCWSVEMIMN